MEATIPKSSVSVVLKSSLKYLLCFVLGSICTIAALHIWSTPVKNIHGDTALSQNNNEAPVIPFTQFSSDYNPSIIPPARLPSITFSKLWAKPNKYVGSENCFFYSGSVKISATQSPLLFEENAALGPDSHYEISIISGLKHEANDGHDVIKGFVNKNFGEKLIDLMSEDENKIYRGCFLLCVPEILKDNMKKNGNIFGDRVVRCEVLAFGSDEQTLRAELAAIKR